MPSPITRSIEFYVLHMDRYFDRLPCLLEVLKDEKITGLFLSLTVMASDRTTPTVPIPQMLFLVFSRLTRNVIGISICT